jgi:hypothetical protein
MPPAEGVKLTEMLQLPPAATLAPQVVLGEIRALTPSPKYQDERLPFVLFNDALRRAGGTDFDSHTSDSTPRYRRGCPVPLNAIVCGDPGALFAMVRMRPAARTEG